MLLWMRTLLQDLEKVFTRQLDIPNDRTCSFIQLKYQLSKNMKCLEKGDLDCFLKDYCYPFYVSGSTHF